eukprot:s2065_g2.t1
MDASEGDYVLSLDCTIANTTAIPVGCGSVVFGSTAGLPSLRGSPAGAKRHIFCPNQTHTAQVSTCGSSFDTVLYINGSDVNVQSQGYEDLCFNQETVRLNFKSGECYDIIVSGSGPAQEGSYVLSIDCFVFECGSTFSGSTIGFHGGLKTHLFCPKERGRMEASTCGSNFNTEIQINDTEINFGCRDRDCLFDINAACTGFNFRPGECYQIGVGGIGAAEGDYLLSLNCTVVNATPVSVGCGSVVTGSTLGFPDGKPHIFCSNEAGRVEVSACSSSYDALLRVNGTVLDNNCGKCPFDANAGCIGFNVRPGECYEIMVDGERRFVWETIAVEEEGDYLLSVNCIVANAAPVPVGCGSVVTGSTIGLPSWRGSPASAKRHIFCPNRNVAAQISTCGSDIFNTVLYINGSGVEYSCTSSRCEGDCWKAETTLNFNAEECYDIVVSGSSERYDGDYVLSVDCTPITPPNVTCPIYLWNLNLLEEIRDFSYPITVWGSEDEAESALIEWPLLNPSNLIIADRLHSQQVLERLKHSIHDQGIHLIVYGDPEIIRGFTGWNLGTGTCEATAHLRLDGGGFALGPDRVPKNGFLRFGGCVRREELPATVDGLYGSLSASAWTTPYGTGRITNMANYGYQPLDWGLEWKQLIRSSVGLMCAGVNTTTINSTTATPATPVPVACGSIVNGTISHGDSLIDGIARHTFCTPEEEDALGEVLFSTCGSAMDTSISLNAENYHQQCVTCGNCGQNAELKVRSLASGTCYDVSVYSKGNDAGNYSLWVSCCEQELCNGNGVVRHIAWGPPVGNTSGFDVCRCQCRYPFSGTACDQCSENSLTVPSAGDCKECFPTFRYGTVGFLVLESSSAIWSPMLPYPECEKFKFELQTSPFITATTEVQNGTLKVSMESCQVQYFAGLFGSIIANSRRSVATAICVPRISCNFDVTGASLGIPDRSLNGSNLVSFHMLTLPDKSPVMAALALLDLLSSFNSSRTAMLHDRSQSSSLRISLNSVSEAQEFFNNLLQSQLLEPFLDCVLPGDIVLSVDSETELVVLVGKLCGSSEDISALLRPLLQPGRSIVLLGSSAEELPSFVSMVNPEFKEVAGSMCTYLTSWLLSRSKGACVDAAEVKFSPETAVAFRRSVLGFPGLCAIASCCVGEQCSDFLTMTGPTVSCYIPLLELGDELGVYNISVIFPNGSRAFAKHPLLVSRPPDESFPQSKLPFVPEVRRYSLSPKRISGVFLNWTREVSLIATRFDRPGCCDFVAIGFDLTVMGKLVTKVCDLFGDEPVNVTLPQIEDEHPFPEPVKFFAVRCFVDTQPVLLDGSSCAIPDAPPSAPATKGAEDQVQTWNLRKRIDEYIDSLFALQASKRAFEDWMYPTFKPSPLLLWVGNAMLVYLLNILDVTFQWGGVGGAC